MLHITYVYINLFMCSCMITFMYVCILCIGVKFHNIKVLGGFTGSRIANQNNRPFPHRRGRGTVNIIVLLIILSGKSIFFTYYSST